MTENYKADGSPVHVAEDGTPRKSRYGTGRQPGDDIVEQGWAPHFAAGNVLKYLRRDKDREHSVESARWYYERIKEMVDDIYLKTQTHFQYAEAYQALKALNKLLTNEEKATLDAPP